MQLTLTIDLGNAAFDDEGEAEGTANGTEPARILRELADNLEEHGPIATDDTWSLRDYNGNTVGRAEVTETPREQAQRANRNR